MPSGMKITSLTLYLNTSITPLQFSLTTSSPLKPSRKTTKNSILYHPRAAASETQKWAALHLFDFSWLNLSILISPCISESYTKKENQISRSLLWITLLHFLLLSLCLATSGCQPGNHCFCDTWQTAELLIRYWPWSWSNSVRFKQ